MPAADPALQSCAPGAHTEEWQLALLGAVRATLPIAVDMAPAGGSLRLTLCLGPLRAAGVVPTALTFGLLDVHNPAKPGIYRWSAFVAPFDAAGAVDQARASELRADVPLPEALTATAAFDRKTRILTVRGVLTGAGKPRGGITVHFVRPLSGEADTIAIGSIRTTAAGAYAFRKKIPAAKAGAEAGHRVRRHGRDDVRRKLDGARRLHERVRPRRRRRPGHGLDEALDPLLEVAVAHPLEALAHLVGEGLDVALHERRPGRARRPRSARSCPSRRRARSRCRCRATGSTSRAPAAGRQSRGRSASRRRSASRTRP